MALVQEDQDREEEKCPVEAPTLHHEPSLDSLCFLSPRSFDSLLKRGGCEAFDDFIEIRSTRYLMEVAGAVHSSSRLRKLRKIACFKRCVWEDINRASIPAGLEEEDYFSLEKSLDLLE